MFHHSWPSSRANKILPALIGWALSTGTFFSSALAQDRSVIAFSQFYRSVANARFEDYAGKNGVRVANADEFARMKAHIVSTYEGVRARNSFVLGEREVIDCIDVRTQPALRKEGKFTAPEKPPAPLVAREKRGDEERKGQPVTPMLSAKTKDRFGNVQYCQQGFIPMRRITLDDLVRYETLADFFNKYGKAGEKGDPQPQ